MASPKKPVKKKAVPAKKAAAPAVKLTPLKAPLARTAKGKRPRYFQDPATDRLQSIVIALMAELSVTRDRLDTLERVLEKAGGPVRALVESYVPDASVEAERSAARSAFIARVLRPLSHELDEIKAQAAA